MNTPMRGIRKKMPKAVMNKQTTRPSKGMSRSRSLMGRVGSVAKKVIGRAATATKNTAAAKFKRAMR